MQGICNINAELRDLLQDTDGVAEMVSKYSPPLHGSVNQMALDIWCCWSK